MEISTDKNKVMINSNKIIQTDIYLYDWKLEEVDQFKYLGATLIITYIIIDEAWTNLILIYWFKVPYGTSNQEIKIRLVPYGTSNQEIKIRLVQATSAMVKLTVIWKSRYNL